MHFLTFINVLTWCQHGWREDNKSNEIIRHWHQIIVTLGNDNRLLSSFPNIFIWKKNDSNLLHRESQTKIYSQNSIHWSFSNYDLSFMVLVLDVVTLSLCYPFSIRVSLTLQLLGIFVNLVFSIIMLLEFYPFSVRDS